MFRLLALVGMAALAGCVVVPERVTRDARYLAIGDSVLAWNRENNASIVDVAERVLGKNIVNAAVPGAGFAAGNAFGPAIPGQYQSRDWDAVVLNGGANDLRDLCGCRACEDEIDRLVSRDGSTGAYPDLIGHIDAPVVIVGYYGPVDGGGGSFSGCDDELQEMERRLARLAVRQPGVTFLTVRDLIDGTPALYDADRVHPSPQGSARIGARVGRALVAMQRPAR